MKDRGKDISPKDNSLNKNSGSNVNQCNTYKMTQLQGVHSVRKVRIGQDWSGYISNFGNGQEKHGKTWKKVWKILNIVHGQEKVRKNT